MAYDYAWEKFYAAVHSLATGEGSLQERLGYACSGALVRLRDEDLPREMRDEFKELMSALTREEAKGEEGTIAATMHVMDSAEARKHADTILSMYDQLAKRDPVNEYHQRGSATS